MAAGDGSWGIALSGGGVLGAAHLGVLRALEEWGLRPAVEVGASAGGLVVGARASGLSTEAATAFLRTVCAAPWRFALSEMISFTRGLLTHELLGLLSLRPMLRDLVAAGTARDVGKWPATCAVMAVNIGCPGGLVRIQGGSDFGDAVDAVQATSALPGLFAALRRGDHLYIDGGLQDDLPVDAAFEMGAAGVLAVNVGGSLPLPPLPEHVPLAELLQRAVTYGTASLQAACNPRRGPVVALAPEIPSGAGLLSFAAFDVLVEAGYRSAVGAREAIEALVAGAGGAGATVRERAAGPDPGAVPAAPQGENGASPPAGEPTSSG